MAPTNTPIPALASTSAFTTVGATVPATAYTTAAARIHENQCHELPWTCGVSVFSATLLVHLVRPPILLHVISPHPTVVRCMNLGPEVDGPVVNLSPQDVLPTSYRILKAILHMGRCQI